MIAVLDFQGSLKLITIQVKENQISPHPRRLSVELHTNDHAPPLRKQLLEHEQALIDTGASFQNPKKGTRPPLLL